MISLSPKLNNSFQPQILAVHHIKFDNSTFHHHIVVFDLSRTQRRMFTVHNIAKGVFLFSLFCFSLIFSDPFDPSICQLAELGDKYSRLIIDKGSK